MSWVVVYYLYIVFSYLHIYLYFRQVVPMILKKRQRRGGAWPPPSPGHAFHMTRPCLSTHTDLGMYLSHDNNTHCHIWCNNRRQWDCTPVSRLRLDFSQCAVMITETQLSKKKCFVFHRMMRGWKTEFEAFPRRTLSIVISQAFGIFFLPSIFVKWWYFYVSYSIIVFREFNCEDKSSD